MRWYEEPQLKCAMFSSESISAAAGASDPDTSTKTDLNEWLKNNNVAGDVAVVKWTEMGE